VLSASFLRDLAQLSWFEKGPLLAIEFLEKHGIAIIIEPSLKGTRIDGAALKDIDGQPIIGLSLRYDRLDNFWFTLLHEVAHIWKHVHNEETFLDDLDASSMIKKNQKQIDWQGKHLYQEPSGKRRMLI
jgi:HTH-type transcriptional regulator/antitoxin HigA